MTATSLTCHVCGTEPRKGARFCDACGSALSVVINPAEYKQVTVLSADVVVAVGAPARRLLAVDGDHRR